MSQQELQAVKAQAFDAITAANNQAAHAQQIAQQNMNSLNAIREVFGLPAGCQVDDLIREAQRLKGLDSTGTDKE